MKTLNAGNPNEGKRDHPTSLVCWHSDPICFVAKETAQTLFEAIRGFAECNMRDILSSDDPYVH